MTEKPKPAERKAKAATVWNLSDRALALPDGTLLPVAEVDDEETGDDKGTVVTDWSAFEENETVQAWIDEGLIEVGAAPAEPEEPEDPLAAGPKLREKTKDKPDKTRPAGQPAPEPPTGQAPPPKPKV